MRIDRLDGIRALAVTMVFINHTDHAWIKNWGWQGVDLFFVLSGFLITGILRRDRKDHAFWEPFYIKRATRILPPLAACLLGSALLTWASWKVLWPYDVFFLGNLGHVLYPQAGGPLGVLWSLAVEEHFYLLWPFAVRFCKRATLIPLLAALVMAEPVIRLLSTHRFGSFQDIYMLTPFRLDALAYGSLLALLLEDPGTRSALKRISGPAASGFIALYVVMSLRVPSFALTANSPLFNSIGYSIVALAAVSGIAFVNLHEASWISTVLSWRPAVFIGRISYGMYLFHLIVLTALDQTWEHFHIHNYHALSAMLVLTLSVGLSWASFMFYERPMLVFGHKLAEQDRTGTQGRIPVRAPSVLGARLRLQDL